MKKFLFLLTILFSFNSFSQETNYKTYSYTEFFKLIENEKDSVFTLENAFIKFNAKTDSLFIVGKYDYKLDVYQSYARETELIIDKKLVLNNVHLFTSHIGNDNQGGIINNVRFKQNIEIKNMLNAGFYNCVFEGKLSSSTDESSQEVIDLFPSKAFSFAIINCKLLEQISIYYMFMDVKKPKISVLFMNNEIFLKPIIKTKYNRFNAYFFARNISGVFLDKNTFHNSGRIEYRCIENSQHGISNNKFGEAYLSLFVSNATGFDIVNIEKNSINQPVLFDIDKLSPNYIIPIKQFSKGIISSEAYYKSLGSISEEIDFNQTHSNLERYRELKIKEESVYDDSKSFKGKLFNFYKSKFDNDDANVVYVEMKDLETNRLAFIYNQNPSFEGFFTWKINQFLKVFSAYGTKPAKAVVFSMWVILLFAFIYLLFPNSWDAHGRKRIMNRYAFFFKYMNKKSGIHEVYLDNQKEDLLEFDEFKALVAQQGKTVPKFFTATALPLYKWAISGTKFSANVLKRVDIMKGTWNDLPTKKRWWKSFLLIGAFTVAICYDILIKMLNALMLSINTFTTLGFGEIPIKGLPRYLAIIQGFIGWFMLTIFSVSLISQLLN